MSTHAHNNINVLLLVDDDKDEHFLFRAALNEAGCSDLILFNAFTAQEGLDLLKDSAIPPNIVFLDINMPGMDGFECLSNIHQLPGYHNIPIVIYSTSNARKTMDRMRELGASYFLTKTLISDLSPVLAFLCGRATEEITDKARKILHVLH